MRLSDRLAFDANALTAWIANDPLVDQTLGPRLPALPCVVLEEALRGWIEQAHRDRQKRSESRLAESLKRLEELHVLVRALPILDYNPSAQALFSEFSAGRGNRNRNDLRIAAIFIAHDVPLLTRNVRDFDDLRRLNLETW
jgi:predicted nucleic acid-binding protein